MKYGRQSARNGTDSGKAPAGAGDAAGGAAFRAPGRGSSPVSARAAVILIAGTPRRRRRRQAARELPGQPSGPTGIPASISLPTINLMGLSPVPAVAAPGFPAHRPGTAGPCRCRACAARSSSLSSWTRTAPTSARWSRRNSSTPTATPRQEGEPGRLPPAVNVNQYYNQVQDVAAFSTEHQLSSIPRLALLHRAGERPAGHLARLQTSRSRHPTRTRTSCTPRSSTSSAPTAASGTSPPPMADYTQDGRRVPAVGGSSRPGARGIAQLAKTPRPLAPTSRRPRLPRSQAHPQDHRGTSDTRGRGRLVHVAR